MKFDDLLNNILKLLGRCLNIIVDKFCKAYLRVLFCYKIILSTTACKMAFFSAVNNGGGAFSLSVLNIFLKPFSVALVSFYCAAYLYFGFSRRILTEALLQYFK